MDQSLYASEQDVHKPALQLLWLPLPVDLQQTDIDFIVTIIRAVMCGSLAVGLIFSGTFNLVPVLLGIEWCKLICFASVVMDLCHRSCGHRESLGRADLLSSK